MNDDKIRHATVICFFIFFGGAGAGVKMYHGGHQSHETLEHLVDKIAFS